MKTTLTIAGSDSSGGAGIQADLKTFTTLGVYGMSVLTAITAQNTCGVRAVHDIPAPIVAEQLDAVFEDIPPDAVKIGMVYLPEIIETIASKLQQYRPPHIVMDPVMVSTSGCSLMADSALAAMRRHLFPLAELLTPNMAEARVLAGMEAEAAALTCSLMLIISIVKPFLWPMAFTPVNGMKAAGDVRFAMIVSTITMWIFRVGLCYLLIRGFGFGPLGVWIGMFADWGVRSIIYSVRFFRGRWATKHVLKD